jgi:hypothetical protein
LEEDLITRFLHRYGQAISDGDMRAVSRCWEVPAVVLSDQDSIAVAQADEIENFFGQAVEWYRSRGLVATRPQLEAVKPLSDRLTSVDVRWSTLDATGEERSFERSHYILWRGEDGEPRIRVALTMIPARESG